MSSKHHWAALGFLWAFFKIACVSVGCAAVFIGVVAFGHWAAETAPWQLWAVFWPAVGVAVLYAIGYQISVEQEQDETRWAAERTGTEDYQ